MVPMLAGLAVLLAALFLFIYRTYCVLQRIYYTNYANTTHSSTTYILQSMSELASKAFSILCGMQPSSILWVPVCVVFHSLAALSDNFTKQVSCIDLLLYYCYKRCNIGCAHDLPPSNESRFLLV